jgi:pyruvate dehydrogenase E2 component (dihydrolipoamide acetyltransferase)
MALVEVKVPDIGDFKDVQIIELLVKPGDTVRAEQSLVTVESDKASMEIPSSHAGVVKELKVALGDKINEGTLLLMLETGAAAAPAPAPAAAATPPSRPRPPPPRRRKVPRRPRPTRPPLQPPVRRCPQRVARSTSRCPTSATSPTSVSSSCWSRWATPSPPSRA